MKTVFLFISNFVYSSDFLRTEYIRYLSTKYKVVVFIPPQAFSEENELYYKSPNVIYIPWNLQYPIFWNVMGKYLRYTFIRKYDFEPVVIRNKNKGMSGYKRKVLNFISHLFPKSIWTPDVFTKLEVFFIPISQRFKNIVKEYNPVLVITATPGFSHFDAEAIVVAKKIGLDTVAVNFSWDNLHNGGINFRRTKYLIVWNQIIKDIATKEYGYSLDNVFVSGVMRFDLYFKVPELEISRREFLLSKKLDPNKKTILITTVTKGNYPDEDILLRNLIEAREKGLLGEKFNIFVRLHPKEEFRKFNTFINSNIDNLNIDLPGKLLPVEMGSRIELQKHDINNLKYTLKYSDVVINYVSTMTLEAFIFDKPVINIDFPKEYHQGYNFRHYKPIVDIGAVTLAKDFDSLIILIKLILKNPEIKKAERSIIINKFIPNRDGLAYMRNVDFLNIIISKSHN